MTGVSTPPYGLRHLAGDATQYRLRPRDVACLVLFGATLLGINLGGARALTYHEVTFAQPAREMLRDGHWIVPTIAGVPFTDKPPLTAWLIAGSLALFQTEAEWAARAPSLISAITAAILIAAFASRWWGRRIGMLAGMIQLTTFATLMQARLAESDIHLVTTVVGALVVFAWTNVESPIGRSTGPRPAWIFYTCLGLACLTKALIGPLFILAACTCYLLASQDLRGFRFFVSPVGWVICALLVVPWFVLAVRQYPPMLDNLVLHQFGRFRGQMGAHEPWYAYAYLVPMLLLPWTPMAALAIARGVRDGCFSLPAWRFLTCWALPGLIFLSTSAFKAKHYTLPLLPPFVILAAVGFGGYLAHRFAAPRLNTTALWLVTACGTLAAVVAVLLAAPPGVKPIIATILLAGTGIALMIHCEHLRRPDFVARAAFGTVWCAAAVVYGCVMPHYDSYRSLAELAGRVNQRVQATDTIYMVRLPESAMTYYLDSPLLRFDDEARFTAAMAREHRSGPLTILAPRRWDAFLRAFGPLQIADEATPAHKARADDRATLFILSREPGAKVRIATREASRAEPN